LVYKRRNSHAIGPIATIVISRNSNHILQPYPNWLARQGHGIVQLA
jgi:hypothetical protein